jgi:hypothetical protein
VQIQRPISRDAGGLRFLSPGEGGKEPEAEEKPRIAAGAGVAAPTTASLLRGGMA